jgi:hypothetical protein
MKASMALTLMTMAFLAAGCGMLSYDGMPTEDEPHAVVVQGGDLSFESVDGHRVEKTSFVMFKRPWVRLPPGQHEIVTSLDYERNYSDHNDDDEWVFTSVRGQSPHMHTITLLAEEGVSYTIKARINVPSYRLRPHASPGTIQHVTLRDPDEWHPFVAGTKPIKGYWKDRASASGEAEHETPASGDETEPADQ